MLSLLSSSDNYLRLTQIAHAHIVLNTSCKKSEYEFAECVIVMLSLDYHLWQSQKQEFVFSIKSFSCFQGVQPALMERRHVPFWGILVSKLNVLPFLGGATSDGSGTACPFFGHSCLQNKCFTVFRGCNRRRIGWGMSQNEQTIYFWNKNVHFRDMKQRISAQNGPNLQNYLCTCPFLGHSYFEFKWFAQIRTCNIMCIFITCNHAQMYDT